MPTAYENQAALAGRIASAKRQEQLDKMNAAWEAQGLPGSDRYAARMERERAAFDRERHNMEHDGHLQRVERTEFEIMRLERLGRHWWTPAQTDTYVKLCHQRDASKEWLADETAARELSAAGPVVG